VPEMKLTAGEQKRDFIYVGDVVEAFCASIEKCLSFDSGLYEYEIGTGKSHSIKDFICLVKSIVNNDVTKLRFGALSYREKEVMDSFADIEKISRDIGWSPLNTLEEGLKKTINWYKNNPDKLKL